MRLLLGLGVVVIGTVLVRVAVELLIYWVEVRGRDGL